MKVDVVMCTWNSNKPYFAKCLNSIKREVPVHHFILVDRFSKDGTVETVREVFPNVRIKQSNASLAVSRKLGIELVDTKFFVFVDSDMELCNGWFKRIVSQLDSKTGAIQGSRIYPSGYLTTWVKWSRNIQAKFKEAFAQKVVIATPKNPRVLRGDPSNTLMRTCPMKDYNPPAILSGFEDHMLLRWILRKGFSWKRLSDPIAIHHGILSINDEISKGRWSGAGERFMRFENMSILSLMVDALKPCICALFVSVRTKQPMILTHIILLQLGRVQGWVTWIKYLELER